MENRTGLIYVIFFALLLNIGGCKDDGTIEAEIDPPVQNENAPQLIEPANNSFVSNLVLKWSAYDNASSYVVQLSLDANFITTLYVDTVLSSTELPVNMFSLNTNVYYYWRVLANLNGGGSTGWSAIWRFSIILPAPPAPQLLLPANNSVNQSFMPLFDWDTSPTADAYRLQVSSNPAFTSLIFDSSFITATQLQCPPFKLITGTQYFWRVNASNSNGASISQWSEVFSLTTLNGPLPFAIIGRITFADTNFLPSFEQLFYSVAAYENGNWPPSDTPPFAYDSLIIQNSNNVYFADFSLNNLPDDTYFVAVTLKHRFFTLTPVVLGVMGCDTARTMFSGCAVNPPGNIISGGNGLENINILSWADSSKGIF